MKVVQINTFSYKATGSIMMNLHMLMKKQGIDSYVVWGRGRRSENDHEISMTDNFGVMLHGIYSRITDKTGFSSKRATKRLIKKLKQIKPDIIHIHNLHGYYINIELLFKYIREEKIKIVWTLHDCWPFTGHCAYFDMIGCKKWKECCYDCEQSKTYPASKVVDNSKWNFIKKKELFLGLDITLVSVSKWLANVVKESFLGNYPVEVIYNGIDLSVFKPTKSDFRAKNDLEHKFIILGVASEWTERKGLKDFIKLSEKLDDKYKVVLVGLSNKQRKEVGNNILCLPRTNNIRELVEIYSASDVFLNASVEETMGMTTVEAMASGTVPIVYNATALPEVLDKDPSKIVQKHDIDAVLQIIKRIPKETICSELFVKISKEYDKNIKFMQYIDLYERICRGK